MIPDYIYSIALCQVIPGSILIGWAIVSAKDNDLLASDQASPCGFLILPYLFRSLNTLKLAQTYLQSELCSLFDYSHFS